MIALEEVSPMALHSTYEAATLYIRINREIPNKESVQALMVLKNALRLKNRKWEAAGAFLGSDSQNRRGLKLTFLSRFLLASPGSERMDESFLDHVVETLSPFS